MIERWQAAQVPDTGGAGHDLRHLPDYVPGCTVIMFGCRPWVNLPGIVGRAGNCPACKAGIRPGDDTYYCALCDGVSPRVADRIRAARIGLKRRDRAEVAANKARDRMRNRTMVRLTESERRQLWNGHRGGILAEVADELTNLARVGRDWLTAIGQAPDWSLILDGRGNVIGRTCGLPAAG